MRCRVFAIEEYPVGEHVDRSIGLVAEENINQYDWVPCGELWFRTRNFYDAEKISLGQIINVAFEVEN